MKTQCRSLVSFVCGAVALGHYLGRRNICKGSSPVCLLPMRRRAPRTPAQAADCLRWPIWDQSYPMSTLRSCPPTPPQKNIHTQIVLRRTYKQIRFFWLFNVVLPWIGNELCWAEAGGRSNKVAHKVTKDLSGYMSEVCKPLLHSTFF